MMVTFVSECEKKALKRTRRVLDAFANRIGTRTWQTIITEEGLLAVKKLLKRRASKNTAVSCHWIRSRSRSDLVWVVGKRSKFSSEGYVPVNYTSQETAHYSDGAKWKTLDIIKYAASIAALFHDFGKATPLFQNKIDPNPKKKDKTIFEPYRHEWISLRLFQAFVSDKTDDEWLRAMSDIEKIDFKNVFRDGIDGGVAQSHPFRLMAPFSKLVAWLILTHHRLPLYPAWKEKGAPSLAFVGSWIEANFDALWNSYNCRDDDQKERIPDNWSLENLPTASMRWKSEACAISSEARVHLRSWFEGNSNWIGDQVYTSHISRLCLIMADHFYSSRKNVTEEWRSENYLLYANTYTSIEDGKRYYKQRLDEHLIGVTKNAYDIASKLPAFNASLRSLEKKNPRFTGKVPKKYKANFGWQDDARKVGKRLSKESTQNGFFGINMASTGRGKTLANAKIMYALGEGNGRIRFSVALGLRSLTLQTGREFRKELGLSVEDLAIVVGGSAVKQLFENVQNKNLELEKEKIITGSESEESFSNPELFIDYSTTETKIHSLYGWTKHDEKLERLIQAPVLVSTIDHLISATEGTRGGKQIPAMLRLLSADLVLDEPDDFGLSDLPALCRLIHWAGLLGSRVLLSTATMPPALAYAAFQAYQSGWREYVKANIEGWNGEITCAWFDENKSISSLHSGIKTFREKHEKFVKQRTKFLKTLAAQKKGKIVGLQKYEFETPPLVAFAKTIHQNIASLHADHNQSKDGKTISIGLVRFANINPLVACAKVLLRSDSPADTHIHYIVYHSRFPLAIRSHLENKLDRILKRKKIKAIWEHPEIKNRIENSSEKHHIFVVLSSPVAEVGRDHDYDWAIVEPSSMRSIIQLAGRVLRHRKRLPNTPNIALLNRNFRGMTAKGKLCFTRPGFETETLKLNAVELNTLLHKDQFETIDSIQRISLPKNYRQQFSENLVNLEHKSLLDTLFSKKEGAKIWWKEYEAAEELSPTWCGEVQRQQKFRKSQKDESYYLFINDEYGKPYWRWKNENVRPTKFGEPKIEIRDIKLDALGKRASFWFELDAKTVYSQLLVELTNSNVSLDLKRISARFGEVRLVDYDNNTQEVYDYHPNLGLFKELKEWS